MTLIQMYARGVPSISRIDRAGPGPSSPAAEYESWESIWNTRMAFIYTVTADCFVQNGRLAHLNAFSSLGYHSTFICGRKYFRIIWFLFINLLMITPYFVGIWTIEVSCASIELYTDIQTYIEFYSMNISLLRNFFNLCYCKKMCYCVCAKYLN